MEHYCTSGSRNCPACDEEDALNAEAEAPVLARLAHLRDLDEAGRAEWMYDVEQRLAGLERQMGEVLRGVDRWSPETLE